MVALREGFRRYGVDATVHVWKLLPDHPGEGSLPELRDPLEVPPRWRERWLHVLIKIRDQLRATKAQEGKVRWVDWAALQRVRKKLRLKADQLAALVGVQCGDLVVDQHASHWNGGDKTCACGHPLETVQHRWWSCPRRERVRAKALGQM